MHPELDRVIWHALSGHHAAFSQGNALARRYRVEYAPFAATRDDSMLSLAALHDVIVPGKGVALFTRDELAFPETLSPLRRAMVEQMVLTTRAVVDGVPALAAQPFATGHLRAQPTTRNQTPRPARPAATPEPSGAVITSPLTSNRGELRTGGATPVGSTSTAPACPPRSSCAGSCSRWAAT